MVATPIAVAYAALLVASAAAAEVVEQQSAAAPTLSFVEGSVQRLVSAMESIKQQPGGIIGQYIVGTLQPQALETVGHMQAEIEKAVNVVKECGGMLWNAEREVEHREEILQSDEGAKFECLAKEHMLHKKEKTECDEYEAELHHAAATASEFPPPEERTVQKISELIAEVTGAEGLQAKYEEIKVHKKECEDATAACERQHGECVVDEETIQKFYCSMKYQRDVACAAYDQCYQEAGKKLEAVEAKMKELEAQVKDHYSKMSCFQDGVGNLEQDPSACNHQMFDTLHLDVNYPGVPPEEQCVHLMEMRRDFSNVVCDGAEVVWHPKTPAPAPPRNVTTNSSVSLLKAATKFA